MCDRAYPKKLAFQYLEDLKNEFERVNGAQIETAARPYAFIKFGRSHFSLSFRDMTYLLILGFILLNFSLSFSFCLKIHSYRKQRNCTRTHVPSGILQS